ncbi:MAG: GvpL/GvpF family gas vesicle protein [Bacteroidota bacterium]
MTVKGIYIHGVVPNFYGTTLFQSLEHSGVYAISFQNISAIVSDTESASIDYSDMESLGHALVRQQETIEKLMRNGFSLIIPMRLGTIASTKEEVLNILSRGYGLLIDTLKKIEYLTEMEVVVTWAFFNDVLKNISDLPEVREFKNELMNNNGIITKVDQYKMGMFVQKKLDEKNKAIELIILDTLSPLGLDIKTHKVRDDEMITNSAFLINRNKKEQFEKAIDHLDEAYKGLLNFKLVGPLPCYSFYTIEVKELNPEQVEKATKERGLSEETTEAEINKAYLVKANQVHPDNRHEMQEPEYFDIIQNAYHTLLDYSTAVKQSSNNVTISLAKEKLSENLVAVKIMD